MKNLLSLLLLLCLSKSAHAQLRHSIIVDYNSAYFWDTNVGGPLRFETLHNWYNIPSAFNYSIQNKKWGLSAGYTFYQTFYSGSEYEVPPAAYKGYVLYARNYNAVNINAQRRVFGNQRADFFATAGYIQYLNSHTRLAFMLPDYERLIRFIQNGKHLSGVNFGLIARYRIWKGFTLQASASHTKLFGGDDFNHVSNLRIGYGYTFGGGMNRTPKRQPAP